MLALLCIVIAPSLVAAILREPYAGVPIYTYATGDNLQIELQPQFFSGITDLVTIGVAGSPIDLKSVHLSPPSSQSKNFEMGLIQSTNDYSGAFSVSANAQGSYGAFSASSSAKYMEKQVLTSKSSYYYMLFEKELGTAYMNGDAKLTQQAMSLLLNNPSAFAAVYGRYFISGATLGCQATATVTITAKSEYMKKDLDITAKAAYGNMIGASAEFTSTMNSQKGFSSMSVKVFTEGGDVPATISSLAEVKTKILDPLDTGGKCSPENAKVTRAIVKSWLTFPPIAQLAARHTPIIDALMPKKIITSHTLARLNNLNMKTRVLLAMADKCHQNVFSCVTKQWNEPTDTRLALYTGAFNALTKFVNTLDNTNETVLDGTALLNLEKKLEDIYQTWIKPAEKVTPFTFTFNIRVLNKYDHYADPPPSGTNNLVATFTIDPNHEDTVSAAVKMTQEPHLDNGHANCRHFYGIFHASYQAEVLSVSQWWNRVCGSKGTTSSITFHPGGDTGGSEDFDNIVRTVYSIDVKYGSSTDQLNYC